MYVCMYVLAIMTIMSLINKRYRPAECRFQSVLSSAAESFQSASRQVSIADSCDDDYRAPVKTAANIEMPY